MRRTIAKTFDAPPVPKWEDFGTIEGRLVGWVCAILCLGFCVLIGLPYVIFGDRFDKHVSDGLLRLEEWIGIRI